MVGHGAEFEGIEEITDKRSVNYHAIKAAIKQ
jgi:hypothetical protein